MLPALSFGLRSVAVRAPASNLVDRTQGSDGAVPTVSRVGIEYKPAQSRVTLNQGLGLRLGGDDKVTMRLRKGSLSYLLQAQFLSVRRPGEARASAASAWRCSCWSGR